MFFVRSVPVTLDASTAGSADAAQQVATQVELALEASSPFALSNVYYGHYWAPGSDRAIVYAAYRRRFTTDQVSTWSEAELVLPTFAALLGTAFEPATTLVLASEEGLTAIHWESGNFPAGVRFQPIPPEATDAEREKARTDLLRRFESRKIVDLFEAPIAESRKSDGEVVFRCGECVSHLSPESVGALDVRDKDALAALRRGQARDVALWRIGVGSVALLGVLLLGEFALFAGGLVLRARRVEINAKTPVVAAIMTRQAIVDNINDLLKNQLMPIEMIKVVAPNRSKYAIQFLHAYTTPGAFLTLNVDAQTTNSGEIKAYESELGAKPEVDNVVVKPSPSHENVTPFTLVVTFKPGALKSSSPKS
jgi:hypothetical protein